MDDKTASQAQMLSNRLQKRFRHLKKWAQRTGAGVFRLYDRDIPEIPLALDFYGNCIRLQEAAVSGALYKRPYEKDENDETLWLAAMKESISAALGIKHENVFLKKRQKQKGLSQYEKIGETRFTQIIKEGGLSFKVNLSDYLDTGLFADRRLLRAVIRSESANKNVLNLFSYTGAFSVYAAAGGAASTDSVDLSNTYLNWAGENFLLNGFEFKLAKKGIHTDRIREEYPAMTRSAQRTQSCGSELDRNQHTLIRDDVLEFVRKAITEKKLWDIIVIDPPAFSNSKKMPDNFDINRDITDLLVKCLELLRADGKMFVSVNVRRGAFSAQELDAQLRSKSSQKDLQVIDLDNKITDEDFKSRKIPKAFLIRR
ncbi:MAG: class I SAM-dependent methyltransferase [Treponema sp.]|nr:class I SAM-dependent methyltransferase [Treponema sp.]